MQPWLGTDSDFNDRYGSSVGSPEDLSPLLRRYPDTQVTPDGQRMLLIRNGEPQGVITRVDQDHVLIQRDGGSLDPKGIYPTNNLGLQLDQADLLVQRYVSAIWKANPETNHRQLELTLNIPTLPEGAISTYFSTFAIIGERYQVHPRPVDLDEDIGGGRRVKQAIRSAILDLTNPDASRAFGTQPFSNKLLYVSGSEGRGKSLYPKATDNMLRSIYGDQLESFELPLPDMITQLGTNTADAVQTVFRHVTKNERNGVPTLLHLDGMHALVPPHERQGNYSSDQSGAEFGYYLQTLNPLYMIIKEFGADLGQKSEHVIVYGEGRVPRGGLPDLVARTFRKDFSLERPTPEDNMEILLVQIKTLRSFAQRVNADPFVAGIEDRLASFAPFADSLTGKEIRNVLDDIADRHKAEWDGGEFVATDDQEIIEELRLRQQRKGFKIPANEAFGFVGMIQRVR